MNLYNYNVSHEIERIISLGNWCSTKANINLLFNNNGNWKDTMQGKADIFDWMCMGDYNYLIKALDNDLKDIFNKDDLVILDNVITTDGQPVLVNAIYNLKYKMIWPHLFDNISGFSIGSNINLIHELETMQQIYSKFEYLSNKFISAKDKNTLYVITYDDHIHIPELIRPIKPSKETIISLRDTLTKIRNNDTNFILLFMAKNESFHIYQNILFCNNQNSHSFYDNKLSSTLEQILTLLKIRLF